MPWHPLACHTFVLFKDWDPGAHPRELVPQGQPHHASLLIDILPSCLNIIASHASSGPSARFKISTGSQCTGSQPALLSGWNYGRWWDPTTLESVVLHLAPTLDSEEPEVGRLTVDRHRMQVPWGMDSLVPVSNTVQYPSVRSPTVGCIVGRSLLDHLQCLFPAALDGTLPIRHFMRDLADGPLTDICAANQLIQDDDRGGDPARP
ncbi:hypothetical protein V8D89_009847 [Ganoderma adspersum]